MEIIHAFGNYSIRYTPQMAEGEKGTFNKFIIPETNVVSHDNEITKVIHGDRKFTRQCWADLCRDKSYQGEKIAKAALIYGGEIKSPGKIIMGDGTWYEHSEKHTGYLTVDGGSVCEQFSGDGNVVKVWDPEPEPELVVTVSEPESPISVASLIPEEEEIPFDEDPEIVSLREENARLKENLAAVAKLEERNEELRAKLTKTVSEPKPSKMKKAKLNAQS